MCTVGKDLRMVFLFALLVADFLFNWLFLGMGYLRMVFLFADKFYLTVFGFHLNRILFSVRRAMEALLNLVSSPSE